MFRHLACVDVVLCLFVLISKPNETARGLLASGESVLFVLLSLVVCEGLHRPAGSRRIPRGLIVMHVLSRF